jgi:hypothetical protein
LSALDLDDDMIPSGVIVAWFGNFASIPSGWSACIGVDGLPDLRNKFLRGAGSGGALGDRGGSDSHTHTVEIDDHTHTEIAGTDGRSLTPKNVDLTTESLEGNVSTDEHFHPTWGVWWICKD